MTELELIEVAEAECRAAWAAAPQAVLAHCCHHSVHIEPLREPAANRIAHTLAVKPKAEQLIRLRWFRPWPGICTALQQAYDAWQEADRAVQEAYHSWQEAYHAWQKNRGLQIAAQPITAADNPTSYLHNLGWLEDPALGWLEDPAWQVARRAWQVAYDARQEADRAVQEAYRAMQESPEFEAEHARLFPDCPWNGETIL